MSSSHGVLHWVTLAVSVQSLANLTAEYQKNASNSGLQAVSHVASSEYTGLKFAGFSASVQVTVMVVAEEPIHPHHQLPQLPPPTILSIVISIFNKK